MEVLGARSLGGLLLSDNAFERGPMQVCQCPRAACPWLIRQMGSRARRRVSRGPVERKGLKFFYLTCGPECLAGEQPMHVSLLKSLNRLNPRAWDFLFN